MLRIIRGGQRWLTALFVVGIGGVFVLFLGLQGPMNFTSSSRLVVVGPYEFGVDEFERVRERRAAAMSEQFGGRLDTPAIRAGLDNMAVQELVDSALLALAAEELGLTVSKKEIEQLVLSDPGFRNESGAFDRERFESYTDYAYGSESAFIEDRRRALLSLKMLRILNRLPEVSEGEARAALQLELGEVRIATVILDPDAGADIPVSDQAVAEVILKRPGEVRKLYEENSNEYDRPERVRARHILISLDRDASEEEAVAALERLEAARERIAAGESFDAVASEVSEDRGSALQGGDLGFFARGQMVPEFESAAFSLQPGETGEPVRSDFGWHLIRAEEREEALMVPFADVREELAGNLLRREAAREATRLRAEQLAERLGAGESLEDLARAEELDLKRSGWLRRAGAAAVPGLGPAAELLANAFALEAGQAATRAFQVDERFVLMETLEKREAEPETVVSQLETKREALLSAKRDTRINSWIDVRRKQLLDAGELLVDLSPIRGNS